jgi:hypothetical protein
LHIEVMNRREAVQLCYKPSGGRKVSMISISTPVMRMSPIQS